MTLDGEGRAPASPGLPNPGPPSPVPPSPATRPRDKLPEIPLAAAVAPCTSVPCSQCCHDIEMILTEADIERLTARLGDGAQWFFQADDGYLQLRTREGPAARGSPGGRPCVFLGDDGLCGVWEARPEGCRLYPAVWDEGLRQAALDEDYCPHTEGFALPEATAASLQGLARRLEAERRRRLASPRRPRGAHP